MGNLVDTLKQEILFTQYGRPCGLTQMGDTTLTHSNGTPQTLAQMGILVDPLKRGTLWTVKREASWTQLDGRLHGLTQPGGLEGSLRQDTM